MLILICWDLFERSSLSHFKLTNMGKKEMGVNMLEWREIENLWQKDIPLVLSENSGDKSKETNITEKKIIQQSEYWHICVYIYIVQFYIIVYTCTCMLYNFPSFLLYSFSIYTNIWICIYIYIHTYKHAHIYLENCCTFLFSIVKSYEWSIAFGNIFLWFSKRSMSF